MTALAEIASDSLAISAENPILRRLGGNSQRFRWLFLMQRAKSGK